DQQPPGRGLAQVAREGRVVAQRALGADVRLALLAGLRLPAHRLDPGEFRFQSRDLGVAFGLVALGLGRVVADNEAALLVALAEADVLHAQVVAHRLVAAGRARTACASAEPSRIRSPAIQWPPPRVR